MKNLLKQNRKKKQVAQSHITNDTVAEHRERVLAAGRRHKYPIQYTKRRLIWVTLFVGLALVVALIILGWLQLYVWKDTGDLAYRITRTLPVPVATIDGENALYSDYLLYHRSTLAVLESRGQLNQKDKVTFYQNQSINKALEAAYTRKIARERNISADDKQIAELIRQQREASKLSESAYESVVRDNLRWSMEELNMAMKYTLLKQQVAFAIDENASKIAKSVEASLKKGRKIEEIASMYGNKVQAVANLSVSKDNSDGGLTKAALKLSKGQTTGPIKTLAGDGYYFVTLNAVEGSMVNYSYIRVSLTEFDKRFNDLKKSKVKYFISVDN